jgi:hypothetical protein
MEPVKTEGATFVYRGPTEGIGDLWVRREQEEGGYPVIYSVWEPTEEERKLLAEGGRVELGIVGEPIPPVSMAVHSKEASEPVGDHPFKVEERD